MARSFFRQLERDAYRVSRLAGDLRAMQRGRYLRRVLRRRTARSLFRFFR